MRILVSLLPLVILSGCGGAGGGEFCAFVKEAELAVTFQRNTPVVEVKLNGEPVHFVLDTGAQVTVISEDAFKRLNLATDPSRMRVVQGVGGISGHRDALPGTLQLGAITRRDQGIAVVNLPRQPGDITDGYLGSDVLQDFDVDLDLAHSRVTLYQPRNCAAAPTNWSQPAETLPRPQLGRALPPHMVLVELDGQKQNAVIDTGASYTVVDRARALATGVSEAELDAGRQIKAQGIATAPVNVLLHRFGTLKIGAETSKGPMLLVTQLPGGIDNRNFHMLLGDDYLRRHRVWISFQGYSVHVAPAQP